MSKPPTPLTHEVVLQLMQKTELLITNPWSKAVNYLAHEWFHWLDRIKILDAVIRDQNVTISSLRKRIGEMSKELTELRSRGPALQPKVDKPHKRSRT